MAGRRRSDWALRAKSPSPGRPGVALREDRRRFWTLIAAGQSSWDAAIGVGVSEAVGSRWFREAGGMPPSTLGRSSKPPSERYLSFAEREEVALLRAQGCGVREVARRLGRAASTVSRAAHPTKVFAGEAAWTTHLAALKIDQLAFTPNPVRIATASSALASTRSGGSMPSGWSTSWCR